jgi:hypothetical protein
MFYLFFLINVAKIDKYFNLIKNVNIFQINVMTEYINKDYNILSCKVLLCY